MAPSDVAVEELPAEPATDRVVNDFSIQVATVNGSGSQTANLVLLRSIFQMGVPISGKNLFPSNIAGLPTWYTIRINKSGYIARKKEIDFLVAMNPETAREDVLSLDPGAAVVYDEPLRLDALRDDLIFYPVPFEDLRRLPVKILTPGLLQYFLHRLAQRRRFINQMDVHVNKASLGYELFNRIQVLGEGREFSWDSGGVAFAQRFPHLADHLGSAHDELSDL